MITEEHIEIILRAIRTVSYEDAREHLRGFAVDCRHDAMIDFVSAMQAKHLPKAQASLKAMVEGATVEKDFKDGT